MWRSRVNMVAGALWRRQRRLMCYTQDTPELEECLSPAATLPVTMTLEYCEKARLLTDLGGRYVYNCMRRYAPSLGIRIPPLKRDERGDWNQLPCNRKLVEAFWDLNNTQLHLFSPLDLEALLAAYMQQETETFQHGVRASILSMAVSVACHMKSPTVKCTTSWLARSPLWHIEKLPFDNYLPAPGYNTQKLMVAIFRILFGREVEDVVVHHQQHLDDPDPECTVIMPLRGVFGLPLLLKLYANQAFARSHKTREKAAEELARCRRERFASFKHDEMAVEELRDLLHLKEKGYRLGVGNAFGGPFFW